MGMFSLTLSRILAWVCFTSPRIGLAQPSGPTCSQPSARGRGPTSLGSSDPSNPGHESESGVSC